MPVKQQLIILGNDTVFIDAMCDFEQIKFVATSPFIYFTRRIDTCHTKSIMRLQYYVILSHWYRLFLQMRTYLLINLNVSNLHSIFTTCSRFRLVMSYGNQYVVATTFAQWFLNELSRDLLNPMGQMLLSFLIILHIL